MDSKLEEWGDLSFSGWSPDIGFRTLYGKGPHPLLWACSRTERGKITVSRITKRLNYCVIFIVHIQFTNVAVGRIIQSVGPRVGDPCSTGRRGS
jgi:hypothetical protein